MVEGRFGNSIRFGSTIDNNKTPHSSPWSNEGSKGNPITIIRNGQRDQPSHTQDTYHQEFYTPVTEDINGDDSSIYLCSSQQITNFQPASLHDASYKSDIFYMSEEVEETHHPINELKENAEEDIVMTDPNNLTAEDILESDELASIPETDNNMAYYDIGETEGSEHIQDIIDNNIDIPSTYNLPSDGSINLDEKLG